MKKVFLTEAQIEQYILEIARNMYRDQWRPDYIVGITRGGLIPAVMLSHYLDIPMHTLDVRLRDATHGPESNCWMAEDAFGYSADCNISELDPKLNAKNILIIDEINDTGATFNWIKKDWQESCFPAADRWNDVWKQNVRIAVLIDNESSDFQDVSYAGTTINKAEDDSWIVYPWESWW